MTAPAEIKDKKITVLGSTGSVGTQTLDVAASLGMEIDTLTANRNYRLLEEQCRRFGAKKAWISEESHSDLKLALADTSVKVYTGVSELCALAHDTCADTVCNSLSGVFGLAPTLAAIDGGHDIALSNKETLVEGGALVTKKARENNVRLLPVDSEHSAVFQCLEGSVCKPDAIILTASGGAFCGNTRKQLEAVTPEQATRHPNWSMGKKITVDSSTMMNKGLEIIEAVWLFGVSQEHIEVIIHRESVIHSMVRFPDNSIIAQLARPDMRLCIQYALTYPQRFPSMVEKPDFAKLGSITFAEPDESVFTLLPLARRAISKGGNIPAAMSSANEEAVALFLGGKIKFTDIFDFVCSATENAFYIPEPTVEQLAQTDEEARRYIRASAEKAKRFI